MTAFTQFCLRALQDCGEELAAMIKLRGAVLLLVALVSGCIGGNPPPVATTVAPPTAIASASPSLAPTDTPADTTAPPTEFVAPSAEPTVMPISSPTPPPGADVGTLTIWADSPRIPSLLAAGAEFTTATGTPVRVYEAGLAQIDAWIGQGLPPDAGPDIFVGKHESLGRLVTAGALQPLDIGAKADSFIKVSLDAFTYGGLLYGIPYASQAVALYYNADLMPAEGPPRTWDELKTMAANLQRDHLVTQGYCLPGGDPYHSYALLTGFGGYVFGKSTDGSYDPADVGLDGSGGLAYADELDRLVRDGLLRDGVDYSGCITLMTTGQAAFFITGPWALIDFNRAVTERGLNFGVAPIPMMANQPRPLVDVQGFMINAVGPNRLSAETFLSEYVCTDDSMRQLWEADPRVPVWTTLAVEIPDPNIRAFTESAESGDPMPAIPQMDDVWRPWVTALRTVFSQRYSDAAPDAEAAFQLAAAEIRALIGSGQ